MSSRSDEDSFSAGIFSPSNHPTQHLHLSSSTSSSSSSSRQPNIPVILGDSSLNRRLHNGLKCPTCSKVFSNSSAIAKHKLTHSDERKHVCHICKKAFKRQDHLNGHRLTHASKKPHGCQFCDKSYSDARSLRRHYENAHSDEYESWCFLSRAAEEGEASIAEAVAKMTQLSAAIATSTSASPTSNNSNQAQRFVGVKGLNNNDGTGECVSSTISEQVKVVLMALPLEEPRVVACSLCPRRFKNQSALNGHMRLHGGYGSNHAPGAPASAKTASQLKSSHLPGQSLPSSQAASHAAASMTTSSKLKKSQQHQRTQKEPLTIGDGSMNESLLLLRDFPEATSDVSASQFDWPFASTTTNGTFNTVSSCVSPITAATTSQSMRDWPLHTFTDQQLPLQTRSQAPSELYNAASTNPQRPNSEVHFSDPPICPSSMVRFRKRPSSIAFSGPSAPQFQAPTGAHEHVWMTHRPPLPAPQSLRGLTNPHFDDIRLVDATSSSHTDQDRYSSRMAPPQFQISNDNSSNVGGSDEYSDRSKFNSHTIFGAERSIFLPGISSSSYHQNVDCGMSTSVAGQPHYSPITPASGGFGASSSTSPAFTFPPTDILLASTSTASSPIQQQPHHQPKHQHFLRPCPPRSASFEESDEWISRPPGSVEPLLSLPSSIPPMGHFSPPPPPQLLSQAPPTCHEALTPNLYSAPQQEDKQGAPGSLFSHDIEINPFVQHQHPLPQPLYDHRSRVPCTNSGYQSSVMQQQNNSDQPCAYSYRTTSHQAAYSVPLVPSQVRVFFPDELDPRVVAAVEEEDVRRPITPIPRLLSSPQSLPPQPLPPTSHHAHRQCIELSCVPTNKYVQTASSSEESNVFKNPPLLLPPPLSESLLTPSSTTFALRKVKKKPSPIVIPSFTHRMNPSRLRSPHLWTANSADCIGDINSVMIQATALVALLEPPPYTPPPMLSPNRRGSGLFSSIARSRRPPRYTNPHRFASVTAITSALSLVTTTAAATVVDLKDNKTFAFTAARSISRCQPRSAPAFAKNLISFPSEPLVDRCIAVPVDGPPATVAMRVTMPELTTVGEGCRGLKPLFFGDEDDEFASVVTESTTGSKLIPSGRRNTPDRSNSNVHSPHGTVTATSIAASSNVVALHSPPSSYCCSVSLPTARPRVVEDEEEDDDDEDDDEEEIEDVIDVDEDFEDDIVEDIGVPSNFEPKINIGSAYQADLSKVADAVDFYRNDDRVYEYLLWNPKDINENDPKTNESLSNLMNVARSSVVRNCGLNMEYTFHLLCKYQGDFEMTLRALLHESFTIFDRVYSETEYWTTEEIEKFQISLRRHDKDFHHVSAELCAYGMNKSVKACVEFYYVWKRMNTPHEVNRYRGRTHRRGVPTRSERAALEEVLHPSTNDICDLIDTENHYCRASIDLDPVPSLSVESGTASSTSYNLRRKQPDPNHEFEEHGSHSPHESNGTVVMVGEMATEEDTESFPCRLCGRCFAKVKSRNAHMKSHTANSTNRHH